MADNDIPNPSVALPGPVMSGLSGNEVYCMAMLGLTPGDLIIGNSVYSMGLLGGLKTDIKTAFGGELHSYSQMVAEGRQRSFDRLREEQAKCGSAGVTGVSNDLIFHNTSNNIEFLSIGSGVKMASNSNAQFTTSANGQELFCMVDAGYSPISFVFGNVSYSIGLATHAIGGFKQMIKGEVKEFSDIFNTTRNLALQRIAKDAEAAGANSVVGIKTTVLPFGKNEVHEMVMIGTAANHPMAPGNLPATTGIMTSDLSAVETWSIAKLGYMPLELVMGTSIYSLGVMGGIKASLEELVHGQVDAQTEMLYGARESSINKLRAQATILKADDVFGIKTYIYDLGSGLLEFLAIGTAVRKVNGLTTNSQQLPPQAIIYDRDTYIDVSDLHTRVNLNADSN
jgi:uncharacterized protein YbjQ (UPF0145 family)